MPCYADNSDAIRPASPQQTTAHGMKAAVAAVEDNPGRGQTELSRCCRTVEDYWNSSHATPYRGQYGSKEKCRSVEVNSTEVRCAGEALEAAKARTECADLAKTRHLAHLSRETRTSLNVTPASVDIALRVEVIGLKDPSHSEPEPKDADDVLRPAHDLLKIATTEAGPTGMAAMQLSNAELVPEFARLVRNATAESAPQDR